MQLPKRTPILVIWLNSLPNCRLPLRFPHDARELLLDAARSEDDTIMAYKVMVGLGIRTRDRVFVEPGDRRSEARWKGALEELEQNGLVEALSYKREAFQLTHTGFAMADILNESQKGVETESP